MIVNWILDSWNQFPSEMMHKYFKLCALTPAIDGSEDKHIHCFKEQESCHAGLDLLTQQIKLVREPVENPFVPDNGEIADTAPREMVVDEDQEGDSDIDID